MRWILIQAAVLASLPWVGVWAWRMERRAVRGGRPLSPEELAMARGCGVGSPERVRVLVVDEIPFPGFRWMQRLAARWNFDGSQTIGMALRYGIFVRGDACGEPGLLAHECVHTGQAERCGGLTGFLRRYLADCLLSGYSASSFEEEARRLAWRHGMDGDGAAVS